MQDFPHQTRSCSLHCTDSCLAQKICLEQSKFGDNVTLFGGTTSTIQEKYSFLAVDKRYPRLARQTLSLIGCGRSYACHAFDFYRITHLIHLYTTPFSSQTVWMSVIYILTLCLMYGQKCHNMMQLAGLHTETGDQRCRFLIGPSITQVLPLALPALSLPQ